MSSAEELLLRISGDSTGGQQAIDGVTGSLSSLSSKIFGEMAGAGDHLKQIFEDPIGSVRTLASAVGQELAGAFGLSGGAAESAGASLGGFVTASLAVGAAAAVVGKELYDNAEIAREFAAHIHEISLVMNEDAAQVSTLARAWQAAGGDLGNLNTLVFMFEQRLENSTDTVKKGLSQLGLSFEALAPLSTTDKILAISDAMHHAGEETNVAAAGFDIFGRGARSNMGQLMAPLGELTDGFHTMGAVINDQTAAAARDLQIELGKTKQQTEATWAAIGLSTGALAELWDRAWARMKLAVANVAYDGERFLALWGYLPALLDQITSSADKLPQVAKSIHGIVDKEDGEMMGLAAKGLADYVAHAKEGLPALMSGADAQRLLTMELKDATAELKPGWEAAKKYADVWAEIAQMGTSWVETLSMMRPETRGLTNDLLESGLSQEKVALATGATVEQVKALVEWHKYLEDEMKNQAALDDELHREHMVSVKVSADEDKKANDARMKALKEHNDLVVKTFADERWMEQDHADFVVSRALTTEQAQRLSIQRWYDDAVGKAKALGIVDQRYYYDLAQTARDKMQAVTDAHDLTFQAVRKMQDDLTTGWQKTFTDTLVNTGSFGQAFESIWDTVKKDVENIFASMLSSIISGFLQPLLDNVRNAASSISGMLLDALTGGSGGGGGPLSWATGSVSGPAKTGLAGVLSGLFGGGGAAAGMGAGAAAAGATAAGLGVGIGGIATGGIIGGGLATTTIGTGAIGAVSSTSSMAAGAAGGGSALGTIAGFLATNPIGWAIDAGLGALALWNHFSGPDDDELAGREVFNFYKGQVWAGLSADQQKEAAGAGWSDQQDAGLLVGMRDRYAAMGTPHPEAAAEAYYNNATNAITMGRSAETSALQDVASFVAMASGGFGRVTKPTLFLAGEAGDEDVAFSGGGKSFSGMGDTTIHINVDTRGSFFPDRAALQDLARMVGDALNNRVRQTTQLSLRTGVA